MSSTTPRLLTYNFAVLGCLLFFMPEQLASVFVWKVTAFMTTTIRKN